jgi:hypothetical protein
MGSRKRKYFFTLVSAHSKAPGAWLRETYRFCKLAMRGRFGGVGRSTAAKSHCIVQNREWRPQGDSNPCYRRERAMS